jgi:mannose-6-phosphate isomerase-like protein (cupin superfamily)
MITIEPQEKVKVQRGSNFDLVHLGSVQEMKELSSFIPKFNRRAQGKIFLRDLLHFTGMEMSINVAVPGQTSPFLHAHKENEEAYIFLAGSGQMEVDGELFEVEEGSVIRVSTAGMRAIRNNGTEDLVFICVQAKTDSLSQCNSDDGIRKEPPFAWDK